MRPNPPPMDLPGLLVVGDAATIESKGGDVRAFIQHLVVPAALASVATRKLCSAGPAEDLVVLVEGTGLSSTG